MRELSRRRWLQAMTASAAAAAAACRRYIGPAAVSPVPAGWQRGEERWVATTCGQCPAGCGINVRVVEGRAIKIEGASGHPINGGGLGPKGQSGLQFLYHPDRIRGPLRRNGPRGSGRWVEVGWDDAIDDLGRALRALRASGEPQGLVVVDGEPRGPVPRLWERFLHAYGSPNHVTHASAGDAARFLPMLYMQGVAEVPAYDWKNTEYVLSLGATLFESWCQMIHMTRATTTMRRGRPGKRVKFVHASPRFCVTAAKADEWVPIESGAYGALALGLAHVLVRDELYDVDFVRDRTFGFETWRDGEGRQHRGFRDLVLSDYPPAKVARITGVPIETIERLAREISAHRPAIALTDGTAAGTNGLGTGMAVHALNALAGSIEVPGGVMASRPALAPWPAHEPDPVARRGLAAEPIDGRGTSDCPLGTGSIQRVPEAILTERPYPVRALILYRSNPIFSKPEGRRWIEALEKVPLVVSCSPLPDESTLWADLILPDHTYLERWELVEPAPSSGLPVVGLRQPVVAPRHDTMATGDVVIRLAHAMGSSVADAFPWSDYREASTDQLRGLKADTKSLLAHMEKSGAWWSEAQVEDKSNTFDTPSGKFEFYSQTIASRLAAQFTTPEALEAYLSSRGVATRGDDLSLPHWEPAQSTGDPREYPFALAPYRRVSHAEGGPRHLPWLRELPGGGLMAWKETIEINPDDATPLGVQQGDAVWIETPAGRRRFFVRLQDGIRRGTLGLPLGQGPWPPSPDDAGTAGHGLLVALSDPLAGILAYSGTRARVRKEA